MAKGDQFDYQRYIASREWAVLRERVRERSGDRCERCRIMPQTAVHHLTYERVGHEDLADLQAVCPQCHAFLSAKSSFDPANFVKPFISATRDEARLSVIAARDAVGSTSELAWLLLQVIWELQSKIHGEGAERLLNGALASKAVAARARRSARGKNTQP